MLCHLLEKRHALHIYTNRLVAMIRLTAKLHDISVLSPHDSGVPRLNKRLKVYHVTDPMDPSCSLSFSYATIVQPKRTSIILLSRNFGVGCSSKRTDDRSLASQSFPDPTSGSRVSLCQFAKRQVLVGRALWNNPAKVRVRPGSRENIPCGGHLFPLSDAPTYTESTKSVLSACSQQIRFSPQRASTSDGNDMKPHEKQ